MRFLSLSLLCSFWNFFCEWLREHRCNHHVLRLGSRIKKSLQEAGITGYQFGTAAVSDGISMGTFGMSYSLQSREVIADSVETVAGGHWLDGMVTIPACDKNMPGPLPLSLSQFLILPR